MKMDELQKAIEDITYENKKIPKNAFQVIRANREEAIPYLRRAVARARSEGDKLEEGYQLHFYAVYLLGELQDQESFPELIRLVSLPEETVEYLLGDCVTDGLADILYNTYNGDLELLKRSIEDKNIGEFVRSAMLLTMAQLYEDGRIAEQEWKDFLRKNVHTGDTYNNLYNELGLTICRCHFVEMLPDIRYMLDRGLMDEMYMGKYDSCVDAMFFYGDEEPFCRTPMDAAENLGHWSMFADGPEGGEDTADGPEASNQNGAGKKEAEDFFEMLRAAEREMNKPVSKKKIGRNDPCPCGSGKKYKFCCMNKQGEPIDLIESLPERQKWLRRYPYTGMERVAGRVYLEDYFDQESIEIDKILYLGLMHRPGFIWNRNRQAEEKRAREYLCLAYRRCAKKMEAEQICSLAEYDEKYSIHYRSGEWVNKLLSLLKANNDNRLYHEVQKWAQAGGLSEGPKKRKQEV